MTDKDRKIRDKSIFMWERIHYQDGGTYTHIKWVGRLTKKDKNDVIEDTMKKLGFTLHDILKLYPKRNIHE
jgi:hypothetical protein